MFIYSSNSPEGIEVRIVITLYGVMTWRVYGRCFWLLVMFCSVLFYFVQSRCWLLGWVPLFMHFPKCMLEFEKIYFYNFSLLQKQPNQINGKTLQNKTKSSKQTCRMMVWCSLKVFCVYIGVRNDPMFILIMKFV